MRQALITLALILAFWSSGARASNELLYGAEFTFTNAEMIADYQRDSNASSAAYRHALRRRVENLCAGREGTARNFCTVEISFRGAEIETFEVAYPNVQVTEGGTLKVNVAFDPEVIEAQANPMTLAEWRENASIFQTDLFDAAHAAGLDPHPVSGGGHINVGYKYFEDRRNVTAAFLTDYFNHPELAMGGFGILDVEDGKPLAMLPRKRRQALTVILGEFRRGEINVETFRQRLLDDVYGGKWKGHSLNLDSVREAAPTGTDVRRFELRGVAAQRNMDDWLRDINLIETRVHHLEGEVTAGRIPTFGDPVIRTRPLDTEALARRFRAYVEELGLPWDGDGGYGDRAREVWGSAVSARAPVAATSDCAESPFAFFTRLAEGF